MIQSHDTDVPLFTKKAVTNILLVEESVLQIEWIFFSHFGKVESHVNWGYF